MLIYSEDESEHKKLGIYGLGKTRTKRDYEAYAGMNFKNKKAHPDVYLGNNPNPVTIHSESDWEKCITFEEFTGLCQSLDIVTAYGTRPHMQLRNDADASIFEEPFFVFPSNGRTDDLRETLMPAESLLENVIRPKRYDGIQERRVGESS